MRMLRNRPPSSAIRDEQVSRLVIHKQGEKALKAADLAALFGLTLDDFYRRIGGRLWYLPRSCMLTVSSDGLTTPAFTQGGVMAVCALLDEPHVREIGVEIARLMKQRRRSSANKAAPARRVTHADKDQLYRSAVLVMAELKNILHWPRK